MADPRDASGRSHDPPDGVAARKPRRPRRAVPAGLRGPAAARPPCLRREAGHTLTTTALVHEAYLKLIDVERVQWEDRAHFLALAARAMRQVLVSYARRYKADKRGGGATLSASTTSRPASEIGPTRCWPSTGTRSVVPAQRSALPTVELRFFGGMTIEEIAVALDVAPSTVKLDWQKAKAWLYRDSLGLIAGSSRGRARGGTRDRPGRTGRPARSYCARETSNFAREVESLLAAGSRGDDFLEIPVDAFASRIWTRSPRSEIDPPGAPSVATA